MVCRWTLPKALFAAFLAFSGATQAQPRPREDFDSLVTRADLARQAGRTSEAYGLYSAAYQYKEDPTIAGRMAVTSSGAVEDRVQYLLIAIVGNGGTTDAEKTQFAETLKQLRPLVCVLRIHGNTPEARVSIDGNELEGAFGYGTAFRIVWKPGMLHIRGVAKVQGEAVTRVSCPAGGEADAYLVWSSSPTTTPMDPRQIEIIINEAVQKALLQERCPPPSRDDSAYRHAVLSESGMPRQEDPFADYPDQAVKPKRDEKKPRFSLGVAPVLVFGVATWSPALGPSIVGNLRLHPNFSVGLEARAAWLTADINGYPQRAMTAGGLLHVCGHVKSFFACGLGHLGVIKTYNTNDQYVQTVPLPGFRPGLGGRLGLSFDVTDSIAIEFAADLLGVYKGTSITVEDKRISEVPPILVSTRLGPVWKF